MRSSALLCLLLLPWITHRARQRARWRRAVARTPSAVVLGAGLPGVGAVPRSGMVRSARRAPIFETVFTVVFVASALFLLAGSAVLKQAPRALLRAGAWMAPLLLLMYARRWAGQLGAPLADGGRLRDPGRAGHRGPVAAGTGRAGVA